MSALDSSQDRRLARVFLGLSLGLMAAGAWLHGSGLNAPLMLWFHRQHLGLDHLWSFLTQWGDSALVLLLTLALAQGRDFAQSLVLRAWMAGALISFVLKRLWDVPRPLAVLDPALLIPVGWPPMVGHSMPSGHSMAAAMGAALVAWLLQRPGRAIWRGSVAVLAAGVVASRVAVAAHWPADVLAGSGLGLFLAWAAWRSLAIWPPSAVLAKPVGQGSLQALRLGLALLLLLSPADTDIARWTLWCVAGLSLLWQWRDWLRRHGGVA